MYARDTNRKPRLLISGNHTHLATVYSLNIIRSFPAIRYCALHEDECISRSPAFSICDIATRAGEGLVHCLQATCSLLQEFLHSQSDCRILPRDVIPPALLGAASFSTWFGLTFWLPTAQSKRLGISRY